MDRKKIKRGHLNELLITIGIIVLLGIASQYLFTRFDLTSDKRYTLSSHTKTMMNDLDDIVYFKIYLDGDLPAGFLRLQNATIEFLNELKAFGGDNIQYEIINPAESEDRKTRNEVFKQLYEKGLMPTDLNVKEKDGSTSQKIIFPGVLVSYRGKEIPVNILKNNLGYSPEGNLNSSIQSLEYELTFAINRLINKVSPRIAFITGHGELADMELNDLAKSLEEYYDLFRVEILGNLFSLRDTLGQNVYDLIVLAKPDSVFNERDKFIIDQYIMHGGSSMWLIDPVNANIDSLAYSRSILGIPNNLNLNDQLFKYGVRLNTTLIQDMQCAVIPINNAPANQKPNFVPAPWVYFPLLTPSMNHPITRNLDMVKTQFVSHIDFVGENTAVEKTVLLQSSQYSRTVIAPVLIDLAMINDKISPNRYDKSNLPVSVLLEGEFTSVYENRVPPELQQDGDIAFRSKSEHAKMIVVSDGDVIRNHVKGVGENQEALPLGYDRFTKQTFGNKAFLMNCINYLSGNEELMESRSKEYKLRLLDKQKVRDGRLKWQLINVLLPILMVVFAGLLIGYQRKNKYAK